MDTVKLAQLLDHPELDLRLVGIDPRADTEITWAHVSELVDPTPWLSGGELLLTTGVQLFGDAADTESYCERLMDHGVAALGVSTGASLTHECLPEYVAQAAARVGLPLVEVAEQQPLQVVVKAVAAAVASGREKELSQTSRAQERLARAAGQPDAARKVLTVFERETGAHVALFDTGKRLLDSSPGCPAAVLDELVTAAERTVIHGLHSSGSFLTPEAGTQVHMLTGNGAVTGVVALHRRPPLGVGERVLVGTTVSLLSVAMLGDHRLETRMRRLQERVLTEVVSGGLNARQAAVRMRRLGLENVELQVVYATPTVSATTPAAFVRQLESARTEVIAVGSDRWVVALVVDPLGHPAFDPVAHVCGWHAGISHRVPQEHVLTGLRQARLACQHAGERGVPLLHISDLGGVAELLRHVDPSARAGFAEAVLAPLDAHDLAHPRTQLLPVLRAFLDNDLNLELTASELGLHRHTVRSRIHKIAEVAGRDVYRRHDQLEFHLALEIRDLIG